MTVERHSVTLPTDGDYRSLYVIPGKHDRGWEQQRLGDCLVWLQPDLTNGYYRRAVQGWVNGYPVGHLGNEPASYYQAELLRLAYIGIDLWCRGRLVSHSGESRVLIETLSKSRLERWVDQQAGRVADAG